MKKIPIFYRFFIYFSIFSIVLVLFIWALQSFILPDYYYKEQVKSLYLEIESLDALVGDAEMTTSTRNLVNDFQARTTSRIAIYQKNGIVVYGQTGTENLRQEDLVYLSSGPIERISFDGAMNYLVIIKSFDHYIYRFVIPYQSLRIATQITNQFYALILLVSIVLSLGISIIFSKSVSKPLVELSQIASKMTNLDLSIAYDDTREDEIGRLGLALNTLSAELRLTISKLKLELEKEKETENMRKKFVSQVSHELQTPIAIILGTIEAIEDKIATTPEEESHYLFMLKNEALKMSHLAKDMIELSQLESGFFKIEKSNVHYPEFIESIYEKMKHLNRLNPISIDLKYRSNIQAIWLDDLRMEQVLSNIIQNAYIHSKHATKIEIVVENDEKYLYTMVKNDGETIKDEDLPNLFKSFYKGLNSKKGTGLGLAIVKEIMTLHGGIYGAKNEDGYVVFYIGLPLK
jgi:two-component system, OmpR family, sensor histidine kinase VanS